MKWPETTQPIEFQTTAQFTKIETQTINLTTTSTTIETLVTTMMSSTTTTRTPTTKTPTTRQTTFLLTTADFKTEEVTRNTLVTRTYEPATTHNATTQAITTIKCAEDVTEWSSCSRTCLTGAAGETSTKVRQRSNCTGGSILESIPCLVPYCTCDDEPGYCGANQKCNVDSTTGALQCSCEIPYVQNEFGNCICLNLRPFSRQCESK